MKSLLNWAVNNYRTRVKKQYGITKELDDSLQALEYFVSPIQFRIAIKENGKMNELNENIEPEGQASADYCDLAIAACEIRSNLRRKFDKIPSEKAIKKLPQTMAEFKKLQKHYKHFTDKYPLDDRRENYETKLQMSQKLLDTFPREYFEAKPCKRKIEEASIVSFLRDIKYMETQELFDSLEELTNGQARADTLDKIGLTSNKMRVYEKRYPHLE